MTDHEPIAMRAAFALRRPAGSTTAHLVLDGADRALCGREVGEPAPSVRCTGCASKWAWLPEGRRVVRDARNEIALMLLARVMGLPTPPQQPPRPLPPIADTATRLAVLRHLADAARLLGQDRP